MHHLYMRLLVFAGSWTGHTGSGPPQRTGEMASESSQTMQHLLQEKVGICLVGGLVSSLVSSLVGSLVVVL